jgi:hypothetical protein
MNLIFFKHKSDTSEKKIQYNNPNVNLVVLMQLWVAFPIL